MNFPQNEAPRGRPQILNMLLLLGGAACSAMAAAQGGTSAQAMPRAAAIPEAEEATVATMTPPTPRWAFIHSGYGQGGTTIFDGDTGKMKGMVDTSARAEMAIDPAGQFYYVSESIWTKGDRGTRQDLVAVYDSQNLKLQAEVAIPGRLIVGGRKQNFIVSRDGKLGFVYNMQPSSSVNVVDLTKRKFLRTIELPGCATLFPTPENGFSALCADGSLATVSLAGKAPEITHSAAFFSAANDPVFDNSIVNRATGELTLLSYTGLVYQVKLGASPQIAAPWSIQQAAGVRPGGTAPLDVNWYPGGIQPLAVHRPSGKLYALMHVGEYWTQKQPGTEIWVVDLATRKVTRRFKLPAPAEDIEVTQDDKPLIFLNGGEEGKVHILDGETFEEKHSIERAGGGVITVAER